MFWRNGMRMEVAGYSERWYQPMWRHVPWDGEMQLQGLSVALVTAWKAKETNNWPLCGTGIEALYFRGGWGLGHCDTNWRVAGSFPDVIEFFSWPNPSAATVVLGPRQSLTEMSTRNLPGGKRQPARKADNPHRKLWAGCLENVGASTSHNPVGPHALLALP
jgi:hypothetical protein